MITRPSTDVLECLSRLRNNKDFQFLSSYLKDEELRLYVQSSKESDDVICRWKQGAAQFIAELLDYVDTATDVIKKRASSKRNT